MTHPERLQEMLADRAVIGLGATDRHALAAVVGDAGLDEISDLEFAAAAIDLALSPVVDEPMPAVLRDRVMADAAAHRTSEPQPARAEVETVVGRIEPSHAPAWFPWLVAAAAIVIAAFSWFGGPNADSDAPNLASQFAVLESTPGIYNANWSSTDQSVVAGKTIRGNVVWDNDTQRGIMRFEGLPINDAEALQYQLWIFDGERNPDFNAVDGGVFDVDAESGAIYVPIDAKLPVGTPTLFAITTEPPGGVVKHVSDGPYQIVLTAAPTS